MRLFFCVRKKEGKFWAENQEKGEGVIQQGCVVTAIDRSGKLRMNVSGKGKPSSRQIEEVMAPWITKQKNKRKRSVLCTDGNNAYLNLVKRKNLSHHIIPGWNRKWRKPKLYHLQNVNNLHSRLKKWMARFNGVSDRYLKNYLTYFRVLQLIKQYKDPIQQYKQYTLTKNSVYIPVCNFEKYFKKQHYYI